MPFLLKCLLTGAVTLGALVGGGKLLHQHLSGVGPDTKDCYFDKECHAKVNWEYVGMLKQRFFEGMKQAKEQNSPQEVDAMLMRMHRGFLKAGMPEDRIDYILTKWVRFLYPEALERDHGQA